MNDATQIEWNEETCPAHNDSHHKKTYTFGSTMSAETEVHVFRSCRCAVAVAHDPVGTYDARVTYHTSFNSASGTGRLRSAMAAAKYR